MTAKKEDDRSVIQGVISRYYEHADAKDWENLIDLFSSNITYQRGTRLMVGIAELERFYREVREIKEGEHKYSVKIEPPRAFVKGVFQGRLKNGEEITILFEDLFEFVDGEIVKRKTTFADREV